MTEVEYNAEYYRQALYRLLPELYRRKDEAGELERFTAIFADELWRMRATVDQSWRDLYIETCQDWVVPYLADLVGTNLLSGEAAEHRLDVLNTIRWRQMKGTLAVLQESAEVMWGGGATAVEMFERLCWNQHLTALRPKAHATFNLASARELSELRSPFTQSAHTVDLRKPSDVAGLYFARAVATFGSMSKAFELRGAQPFAINAQQLRFSASDVDVPLFLGNPLEPERAPLAPRADAARAGWVEAPLRNADFALHAAVYFGSRAGFTVFEDGIPLCASHATSAGQSLSPLTTFQSLRTTRGLIVADPSLHAGQSDGFSVQAVRIARLNPSVSPLVPFDQNYATDGVVGSLDTTGGYTPGVAATEAHEAALLLRIQRQGADATFPECELVVQNGRGSGLLVHVPALPGLSPAPLFLYVADDGSTYFARSDGGQGLPDLNPGSGQFGAFLPMRRARSSAGQARPRLGIRPVAHREATFKKLCCWEQPLPDTPALGQVAFDPELGRMMFPPGDQPQGELTVRYAHGRAAEIGQGTARPAQETEPTITVGRLVNAEQSSIQAAVDLLADGAPDLQVIEILDSATYQETVSLSGRLFPGGLVLRAGTDAVPVLRGNGLTALVSDVTSVIGSLTLDGLFIESGNVNVAGNVGELHVLHSTLESSTGTLFFDPSSPDALFEANSALLGRSTLGANVATARLHDCVVQHPDAQPESAKGLPVLTTANRLELERCTVLGDLICDQVVLSNTLQCGLAVVASPEQGCARYSRVDPESTLTRLFRCTSVAPVLISTLWHHPGHVQLHPSNHDALLAGGEEGGEIGAHYSAGRPWRAAHVLAKHREFAPAGIRPQLVRRAPLNRKIWIHRT